MFQIHSSYVSETVSSEITEDIISIVDWESLGIAVQRPIQNSHEIYLFDDMKHKIENLFIIFILPELIINNNVRNSLKTVIKNAFRSLQLKYPRIFQSNEQRLKEEDVMISYYYYHQILPL